MGDTMSLLQMQYHKDHSEEDILNDTKRIMQQIADRYKTSYLWGVLQNTRKEVEGSDDEKYELLQRKWMSFTRPLCKGTLYVLGGNKEHRKWRKRYCILTSDYTFEAYESEDSYNHQAPPLYSSQHPSHEVICNVDSHLNTLCEVAAREFGYVNFDTGTMVKKIGKIGDTRMRPTPHIIGLYHAYRPSVYIAVESEIEKDLWLKSLKDAARHLAGVQGASDLERDAFAFAIEQTFEQHEFCDTKVSLSGNQAEIIADFTADFMANDCKTVLLPKMKGGLPFKFKMWDMISRKVFILVKKVIDTDYPPKQLKIESDCVAMTPEITTLIPQINQAYDTLYDAINDTIGHEIDEILEKELFPKLPDVLVKLADAMLLLIREMQETFHKLANGVQQELERSTNFANHIDRYFIQTLDAAPRHPDTLLNAFELGTSSIEILAKVFTNVDAVAFQAILCVKLQKILDSAIFTFEKLCGDAVAVDNVNLTITAVTKAAGRVAKKLDYDMTVMLKPFIHDLVASAAHESCNNKVDICIKENSDNWNDMIPSTLVKFMPIHNLSADVITKLIKKKIQPMVSIATKRLLAENGALVKSLSNSTINSCHNQSANDTTTSESPDHTQSSINDSSLEDDEDENEQPNNPCPDGGYQDGETGECEGGNDDESQSQPSSHGDHSNNNINDCDVIDDYNQSNGHCEVNNEEIDHAEQEISKCSGMMECIVKTGEEKLI